MGLGIAETAVAGYGRGSSVAPAGRVCVVRNNYYPRDAKLRREVDALIEAGHDVDVVCLRNGREPLRERRAGANVWRLPIGHRRGRFTRYLVEYSLVTLLAAVLIGILHLRRRYQVVQINTPPDILAFAAIFAKLFGARVLIQMQEPDPEFFATKFRVSHESRIVRLVAWAEQATIRFADFVITCTDHMRDAFVERGADPAKIAVIVPTSNDAEFNPGRARPRVQSDAFTLVSHGSIEERYGLDTAIQAVAMLRAEMPDVRLRIFGEGTYTPTLQRLARELSCDDVVSFHGWVPIEVLVQAIADADAGIVAMKRDPFRDLTHCLKMYDFISMRRPAIVSRTRSVDEYFGDDALQKFTPEDATDLARAIRDLRADPARGQQLIDLAARVTDRFRWQHQRRFYLYVVDELIAGRGHEGLEARYTTDLVQTAS